MGASDFGLSQFGRKVTVVSFSLLGKYTMNVTINDQNLVELVDTWFPNPVYGDMDYEMRYTEYKDFGGVKFPMLLHTHQGDPRLNTAHNYYEYRVTAVKPNVPVTTIPVPDAIRSAATPRPRVESQQLANGVWLLGGGTHNSLLVEFKVSSAQEAYAAIARVAGVDEGDVAEALRAGSRLERIGMVENLISEHNITDLADLMKVSEQLPPVLMREYRGPSELMAVFTRPAARSELAEADFHYVGDDRRMMTALLRNAVARKEAGVNILLYGPPGTGKTELAKVAAQAAGLELYEVEYADRDGNSLSGRDRYRSLQISQVFLKASREDLPGALARTRSAWVARRYRWELAFVPALCGDAGPCVMMPFDHQRDPGHPIRQGWLPRLELDGDQRAALRAACQGHARCVVDLSGHLGQLELSMEQPTSMTLSQVELHGAREAAPGESWVLAPRRPVVERRGAIAAR